MAGVSSKAPAFFNTRPTMSDFDNAASPTPRACVPALDAILGKPFKVLDDGFVRAVDYMGSDASIVQAARVSYGEGTKKASDDEHLIRYLMRHRHTTPFEMCELKLHVRVPMDIWRQWVRHRTASINEYSTRYSIAIDSAHATDPREWRTQSTTNRQGSGDFIMELRPDSHAQMLQCQQSARANKHEQQRHGIGGAEQNQQQPFAA